MDKDKAIKYITSDSWNASRLGLERMEHLLDMMDNPHEKLRYIHIAGTNGKGSTSAMLASIMTSAGYKTGLYTSPYINFFNERIQVDGKPISDDDLAAVTAKVRAFADKMEDHPTEFELVTVIALQYYFECGCKIVIMEVGLGGRLDATNIIPTPEVAVITPISLDHTDVLGETLGEIAREKAGIIKESGVAVVSPQHEDALRSIRAACEANSGRLVETDISMLKPGMNNLEGQWFSYGEHTDMKIHLLGEYQMENAALVLNAVDQLRLAGWNISEQAIRTGLEQTVWPARFEVLNKDPYFIVDGGHNPQCVSSIIRNLEKYFPGRKVVFLTGVMADKDVDGMFRQILCHASRVYTVTPDNPRAMPARELAEFFTAQGVPAESCGSVEQGVEKALAAAVNGEVICACGSFYMAGAIRRCFNL